MAKRSKWAPYLNNSYVESIRSPLDPQISKHSEFKKPYLWDWDREGNGFQKMERFAERRRSISPWTRPENWQDQPQDSEPGKDCVPQIVDYSGTYFECTCQSDCTIELAISCSANIKSVNISGQDLSERAVNSENWRDAFDDGSILHVTARGLSVDTKHPYTIETLTANGKQADQRFFKNSVSSAGTQTSQTSTAHYENGRITGIFSNNCLCEDHASDCTNCTEACPIAIDYTTLEMEFSEAQTFTADHGAGCYKWTATPVCGTWNPVNKEGKSIVWTAPNAAPNCDRNVVIKVTDFCGKSTSITITLPETITDADCQDWNSCGTGAVWAFQCSDSVDCTNGGVTVYYTSQYVFLNPWHTIYVYGHNCNDGVSTNYFGMELSLADAITAIQGEMAGADDLIGWGSGNENGVYDGRTAAQLAAGCCPSKTTWSP